MIAMGKAKPFPAEFRNKLTIAGWVCTYCGTTSSKANHNCRNCGSPMVYDEPMDWEKDQ